MQKKCFRTVPALASNYCTDTRGAFAPFAAVMFVALIGVILFTLDVRRMVDTQNKVRAIADAVALETIQTIGVELDAGRGDQIVGQTLPALTTTARETFTTRLADTDITLNGLNLTYVIEGSKHAIEMTYQVYIESIFLSFLMPPPQSSAATASTLPPNTLGPPPSSPPAPPNGTVTIAKRSVAAINYVPMTHYMKFNVLIDVSGSMSTGATYDDQVELWDEQQCSFACHMENIDDAQDAGIKMRYEILLDSLDVLYDEVLVAVDEIQLPTDVLETQFYYFRDSSFRVGNTVSNINHMPIILSLHNSLLPELIAIDEDCETDDDEDCETDDEASQGNTNLEFALTSMAAELNNGGTGSGPDDRRNFVFMITDGIGSEGALDNNNDEGIGTLQTQFCDTIKNQNATLAIILLEYPDYAETMRDALGPTLANDHPHDSRTYAQWSDHYDDFVADPLESMEVVMHSCATEGFFYQASNAVELNEAMRELFSDAMPQQVTKPHLSYLP